MNDTQIEIAVQIARIDETVTDMHHRLFGNGQPGIVEKYETRLSTLESQRSRDRGFRAAIWGVLTLIGGTGILELLRKGF